MIIRELPLAQCTALIAENRLARLACSVGNQPYLVPIFYAYADRCTYSFTMPGRKLDVMRGNPLVALLVEEKGESRSWRSVLPKDVLKNYRTKSVSSESASGPGPCSARRPTGGNPAR